MKGTYEATEYLTKLNDKDPFKKWLEEQRIKSEKMLYLEVWNYLNSVTIVGLLGSYSKTSWTS